MEQQQKKEFQVDRYHFSRIAAGLLIYNVAGVGFQMLAVGMLRLSGWNYLPYAMDLNYLLTLVCMYLFAFPITAAYYQTVPKFGQLRRERWEWQAWLVVVVIGMSFSYLGNLLGNLVTGFFGTSASYEGLMDMIFEGNTVLTVLTVVVGAPIVEEMLFRKFLIDRTIGYGEKLSVILSGTLFGIMHGNFQQFFYAFILGCLFAYIYCKTGNIRNTILFHMWINFCGGVLAPNLIEPMAEILASAGAETELFSLLSDNPALFASCLILLGYAALQLIVAAAGVILFFVFKKYICFYPGIRRLPKKGTLRILFLNPGMAVFVILCVLQFVTGF